ncbi:MAG: single-stranded-DNA-specific exonuclease RecJ [Pseudomonadota bacterium]|nr:single-stranded-DNA-specific exonuclease RecJ [Pseudomonadota bacterium]QKK05419.1 MAG: single-stranded-DNA-specific exonuclease RecJ [Pseudomonadota bacterium]
MTDQLRRSEAEDQGQTNGQAVQAETETRVLDVERSVLGKKWIFPETDERAVLAVAQGHGLPEFLARLLIARGVSFDEVPAFLDPSLKTQLPDPYVLKDMQKSAERIADAIMNGEAVAVFGDYDVDGATSTALLKRFFKAVGHDILVYIPDRMKEGYGPNAKALLHLKNDKNIDLLLTVDCGISAFAPLEAAAEAGLDVIVLDHHTGEPQMPPAYAIVNPNRFDEDGSLGHLAAVGVAFLTLIAVNRVLRDRGYYAAQKMDEPKLLRWLDIVALGTVCDVVPLKTVNRAFVAQGLKVMALRQNTGMKALADVAGLDSFPKAYHLGFLLGPRINAGGRVGESDTGTRLMSTEDDNEALKLSHRLNHLNQERRDIEAEILEQAIEQVEATIELHEWCVIAHGEGWHPGVIGIVASRLKERFNRPACVIGFDENGAGKASGRSVSGIDLGGGIIAARQKDILVAGGGHKMAAGFTVMRDRLDDFRTYISTHIEKQCGGNAIVPSLKVDAVLSAAGVTMDLLRKIEMLAPFGTANPEPRFVLAEAQIMRPKVVGENHIQCLVRDSTRGHTAFKAIAFRALDTELGDILLKSGGKPVHLAGTLSINHWNGNDYINFQIADAAPAW